MCLLSKHVHAKFQISSFYPDGLNNFLTLFQEKFRFYQRISKIKKPEYRNM
jgi:hypothetical protein